MALYNWQNILANVIINDGIFVINSQESNYSIMPALRPVLNNLNPGGYYVDGILYATYLSIDFNNSDTVEKMKYYIDMFEYQLNNLVDKENMYLKNCRGQNTKYDELRKLLDKTRSEFDDVVNKKQSISIKPFMCDFATLFEYYLDIRILTEQNFKDPRILSNLPPAAIYQYYDPRQNKREYFDKKNEVENHVEITHQFFGRGEFVENKYVSRSINWTVDENCKPVLFTNKLYIKENFRIDEGEPIKERLKSIVIPNGLSEKSFFSGKILPKISFAQKFGEVKTSFAVTTEYKGNKIVSTEHSSSSINSHLNDKEIIYDIDDNSVNKVRFSSLRRDCENKKVLDIYIDPNKENSLKKTILSKGSFPYFPCLDNQRYGFRGNNKQIAPSNQPNFGYQLAEMGARDASSKTKPGEEFRNIGVGKWSELKKYTFYTKEKVIDYYMRCLIKEEKKLFGGTKYKIIINAYCENEYDAKKFSKYYRDYIRSIDQEEATTNIFSFKDEGDREHVFTLKDLNVHYMKDGKPQPVSSSVKEIELTESNTLQAKQKDVNVLNSVIQTNLDYHDKGKKSAIKFETHSKTFKMHSFTQLVELKKSLGIAI